MATIEAFFNANVSQDIVGWARPVVETICADSDLASSLNDPQFRRVVQGIISQAYHMNFPEDSDPSGGIGLEALRDYSPRDAFGVIFALKKGSDLCGYIGQCVNSFVRDKVPARVAA